MRINLTTGLDSPLGDKRGLEPLQDSKVFDNFENFFYDNFF